MLLLSSTLERVRPESQFNHYKASARLCAVKFDDAVHDDALDGKDTIRWTSSAAAQAHTSKAFSRIRRQDTQVTWFGACSLCTRIITFVRHD